MGQIKPITVKQLYEDLGRQIKRGHANKKILVPVDDECNELRMLYMLTTAEVHEFEDIPLHGDININECIILG